MLLSLNELKEVLIDTQQQGLIGMLFQSKTTLYMQSIISMERQLLWTLILMLNLTSSSQQLLRLIELQVLDVNLTGEKE